MDSEQRAKIFKALSDPKRVDMIDLLARDGTLCGTALSDKLGISMALVCHHAKVLTDAGILVKERVGQLRMCTLDLDCIREASGKWEVSRSQEAEPARTRSRRAPARKAAPSRTRSTRENA